MLEGIRLASLYEGRKVIVTPGLVESNTESNETLAQKIDEVFDVAIITGELNSKTIASQLKTPKKSYSRIRRNWKISYKPPRFKAI